VLDRLAEIADILLACRVLDIGDGEAFLLANRSIELGQQR
jgi:hypothetical protein